jgi:hypothetical protein
MIQADMTAYRAAGEAPQLGLPDKIGTPELAVGYTPACCSDHQSFDAEGFAATQVFERAGPIADPSACLWFPEVWMCS